MFPYTYPDWPLAVGMGLTPLVTTAVVMNKKVGNKLGFHRLKLPGDPNTRSSVECVENGVCSDCRNSHQWSNVPNCFWRIFQPAPRLPYREH